MLEDSLGFCREFVILPLNNSDSINVARYSLLSLMGTLFYNHMDVFSPILKDIAYCPERFNLPSLRKIAT